MVRHVNDNLIASFFVLARSVTNFLLDSLIKKPMSQVSDIKSFNYRSRHKRLDTICTLQASMAIKLLGETFLMTRLITLIVREK